MKMYGKIEKSSEIFHKHKSYHKTLGTFCLHHKLCANNSPIKLVINL